MNLHEDAKMKIERKEEQELEILGEILEAYVDTPIKKDAFLIGDLGLDSFLIVYFISEVDDRFGAAIEMPEHVEYMTVQDVLDQLNWRK
ncbi:acyl carrier protein [Clostridium sp. OF09-10]|nr:acyl carrier protein [Clostridium sp. OF09-10]